MTPSRSAAELFLAAKAGNERALGRVLSAVETDRSALKALSIEYAAGDKAAYVIGITGAPGVGKSTLVSALLGAYRAEELRVAVVAVDPSSPISGGALLGDRIRMQAHTLDDAVFIRSVSSRGHLGGLSSAAPDIVDLLARVGFDLVVVETVGVGQDEVEIATYADSVVVVAATGAGDGVQAAKAGILEIADIFVVNKADLPGTADLTSDLRQMLSVGEETEALGEDAEGFEKLVIELAARDSLGIQALVDELKRHRLWLEEHGELGHRRRHRVKKRLSALARDLFVERLDALADGGAIDEAVEEVLSGTSDVHSVARELLERVISSDAAPPGA